MIKYTLFTALIIIGACQISKNDTSSRFRFVEDDNRLELYDADKPVLFYQKATKDNGESKFNHYIHPLYNLSGMAITEEFPNDHLHHRGLFWTWHQLYIDGRSIGSGWIMEDVLHYIRRIKTYSIGGNAHISLYVQWISTKTGSEEAFMDEHTLITIHPIQKGLRIIDFEINLKALLPGLSIGGSQDTIKGYGGFSLRIKMYDSMSFRSDKGPVEPQEGAIAAGPWMDFSTPGLSSPDKYGLAILCHPSVPNHPAPWILRRKGSMQNIVFPGWKRVNVSTDRNTKLRYRLVIHDGNASIEELEKQYEAYGTQ